MFSWKWSHWFFLRTIHHLKCCTNIWCKSAAFYNVRNTCRRMNHATGFASIIQLNNTYDFSYITLHWMLYVISLLINLEKREVSYKSKPSLNTSTQNKNTLKPAYTIWFNLCNLNTILILEFGATIKSKLYLW